jgi:hypothetical protein
MENDFSEIRNNQLLLAKTLCGVPTENFDTTDTLYYDESGNSRLFWLKNGKYNVNANTHFVLGGIQSEEKITFDDLRSALKLNVTSKEAKSSTLFKGTFEEALSKKSFSLLMQLIIEKGWHIHFDVLNMLYYSLVDIIESLNLNGTDEYRLKDFIYHVFKEDIHNTESFLVKYSYPNIPKNKVNDFLDELLKVILNFINKNYNLKNVLLFISLVPSIINSKNKELPFIQDEETNILIKEFDLFYMQELWKYYKAKLVFDEEVHIKPKLESTDIVVNGEHVSNWTMVDSKDEPLEQVSDLVVGLMGKYFVFLDDPINTIQSTINGFSQIQSENFKQWIDVLNKSYAYNKSFFEMTVSLEQNQNFFKLLETE